MNALFGDATTATGTPATTGTPALGAETDALIRPGSPVPPLDIRGRPSPLGTANAIPGLDIDPPAVDVVDGRPRIRAREDGGGGIGGWISKMIRRGRSPGEPSSGGRYAPLGQGDE